MKKLLHDGGTDNFQLIKYAEKLKIPLVKACYKDQLQFVKPKQGFYLINMNDSTSGTGTHWIGAWLHTENNKLYLVYFDAAGAPYPQAVEQFAGRCGAYEIIYSTVQIQQSNQNYCGQYVLTWMYTMHTEKGSIEARYNKFLSTFHKLRNV